MHRSLRRARFASSGPDGFPTNSKDTRGPSKLEQEKRGPPAEEDGQAARALDSGRRAARRTGQVSQKPPALRLAGFRRGGRAAGRCQSLSQREPI